MVLIPTLLHKMKRKSCFFAAIVLCIWLTFVGVGVALAGRAGSPSTAGSHRQPSWVETGGRALFSAAGSTFEAMLARRNRTVLTGIVGRSTGGRSVVAALSIQQSPLTHQHSPGVATSDASTHRVSFG